MIGAQQQSTWPLPRFFFSVDIEGFATPLAFQEVTGLDNETQLIEYRIRDSQVYSTINMPGMAKINNVTFKKGIFASSDKFWNWYSQIKMNTIKRQSVTIKLLDDSGNPTMVWQLRNAWPTKITGTDLKADGNEVAIETLEIAHEGLTIQST